MNKDMIRDLKLVDETIKFYVSNKEDKHFARSLLGCMIGKLKRQPQQGWIPVSEPPEDEETKIIAWRYKVGKAGDYEHYYGFSEYVLGDWDFRFLKGSSHPDDDVEILAWRELPEFYRPREE